MIFHPQVDKDGNGSISLSEYFEIFSKHGIEVNRAETNRWLSFHIASYCIHYYSRVIKLAGEDGNLTKENFFKIVKSSDFFMKSFDKNKDGVVTEVSFIHKVKFVK